MAGNANSGNRSGNPRHSDKPFAEAIRRAVYANDKKALEDIARVVVSQARAGDHASIAMIADRLDGKAVQQVESHNINEYVFAEVPKTDTKDEWTQSLAAVAGKSSPAHKQH